MEHVSCGCKKTMKKTRRGKKEREKMDLDGTWNIIEIPQSKVKSTLQNQNE